MVETTDSPVPPTKTPALDAALAEVQQIGPIPTPNRGESETGKEFLYAKFDAVLAHVGPALAEKQIAHTAYFRGARLYVEIIHTPSGERRRSWIKAGPLVLPWRWAKRFTFVRRYLLVGLLGLAQVADPDTDDGHDREERPPASTRSSTARDAAPSDDDGDGGFMAAVDRAEKPIHFTALMPRAKELGMTRTLRDAAERAGCVLVGARGDRAAHFAAAADAGESGGEGAGTDGETMSAEQWFARLKVAQTAEDFTALVPTATTNERRAALNAGAETAGWEWDQQARRFADRIPF